MMIVIANKLISDDVVEQKFICALDKCKGACCWEGDYGAPLEEEEIELIEKYIDQIKEEMETEAIEKISKNGFFRFYEEKNIKGTELMSNGACVFLSMSNGIAKCGIEKAFEKGNTTFQKPISCHLYPIRIKKDTQTGIEFINYDRWDICSAACILGEEMQLPVYKFVREALIRKFGAQFYEELEAAAEYHQQKK